MKRQKLRNLFSIIISIIFACMLCASAFAQESSAAETEAAPEETSDYGEFLEEMIAHRLWGFFVGWTEGDTDRMLSICSAQWKKKKGDPRQALLRILESGAPRGYKISGMSEDDAHAACTVSVILQRETDNGGYEYSLHTVLWKPDPDGLYAIDPDGIGSGVPAEPVPEEEMTLMTPEGIIRSSMELHAEEGLYEQLIPISAGVERKGICVEVISGLVRGKNAWFVISLQDTEGQYSGFSLDPFFRDNIDGSFQRWWSRLYHDEADHRNIYLVCQELDRQIQLEDRQVTAGVSDVRIRDEETVDLLPLLEQYGKAAEGVTPPKLEQDSRGSETPAVPDDVRILDWKQPMDIPLFRDIRLTGIGWIGDQLHIQFHNTGREFLEMHNGCAGACSIWVDADVSGRTYEETYVDYAPLNWDEDNNGWTEWKEMIINCKPEEKGQLEISAEISVTTAILEDDWSVRIPLDLICVETEPEPDGGEGE